MNQITSEALDFLEEAKQAFNNDHKVADYISKDKQFIALRTGLRETCIAIYKLDGEVGNFVDVLPRNDIVLIDEEEYKKLKN